MYLIDRGREKKIEEIEKLRESLVKVGRDCYRELMMTLPTYKEDD